MDTIFGQTFDCPCGRTHAIQPRTVVYAPDAPSALAALCAEATRGPVAIVSDARTRVAGAAALDALRETVPGTLDLCVPDPVDGGSPVCDEPTRLWVADRIADARLLVAIGSGVISDLAKWVALERELGLITFATAASMNGYASANVAPTIGGVKTLIRARPPAAVLSTPAVLRDAPAEMTAAGLGDVLAKTTSSVDWYLNHVIFGDYYCRRSVELIAEIEPLYMDNPAGLPAREAEPIAALFEALLLTGVAMTMAETSAPASGGEHLISHSLDMMSALDGHPHDLHGRQVGVGTLLMAELYRSVLAVESPEPRTPPAAIDALFWGRLADGVAGHYAQKAPRLAEAADWLTAGGNWDRLRTDIASMLPAPRRIHDCLAAAGAARRAEHIGCDRQRLLAAFGHGHEIRARFTILDLAYLLGILPDAAQEILARWA